MTDLLLLADPMCSVHCLQIHLGIPVGVIEDDDVGGVQIDAETSGTGRQHEDELLRVFRIVSLSRIQKDL